jgi:2-methylfumaryl-CoA isomerase
MVVALTLRQWDNLCEATETKDACAELGRRLGADLRREGERFKARSEITAILRPWFATHRLEDIAVTFNRLSVTWSEYRTFRQAVEQDPDCSTENPMFALTEQPGIGRYLTPGLPFSFSGMERATVARAPMLGEHTDQILTELGYDADTLKRLHAAGIIAGASPN